MPRVTYGKLQNADALQRALAAERRAVPIGVNASAEPIQKYLELKVGIPYPPPSRPGQPPHRRTGKFQRGWNVKPRGVVLTIRNPVKYAGFLEAGTRKMAARPTLSKSVGGRQVSALVRRAGRTAAESARRVPVRRGGGA